jgi:hypothetical protein
MKMKTIRSLREITRLLNTDLRLRKLCLIKPAEKGYPRSALSRFIRKVEETRLIKIIEEKVVKLLKQNDAAYVDSIFDASFKKPGAHAIHSTARLATPTKKPESDAQADPSD